MEKLLARAFGKEGGLEALRSLEKLLPFQLTKGQQKAIEDIARISSRLLHSLETTAAPKNREEEAAKAKARGVARFHA